MSTFPVIGIMGPSNSGKDLVGDWFKEKGFAKVAFADPMKRFCRAVFGYDTQTLWGPAELRNREDKHDSDWWLSAWNNLTKNAGWFTREVCTQGEQVVGYLELLNWLNSLRNHELQTGSLSCRVVLQTLGTEWGRKKVNDLIWIRYLYDNVAPELAKGDTLYNAELGQTGRHQGMTNEGAIVSSGYKGIIIPDHRFKNEVAGTNQFGGYVILLRRLSLAQKQKESNVGLSGHSSETEQREIPEDAYDLVLELPEGVENVHKVLEKVYQERRWEQKRSSNTTTPTSG